MIKLAKLLNEQASDWEFDTEKVEVSEYNFKRYSEFPKWESWTVSNCTVKWSVDFEVRKYGIKDMTSIVRSISDFFVSNDDDDSQQLQIDISEKSGWKITTGYSKSEFGPSLFPIEVELYFDVKKAKVIFQS